MAAVVINKVVKIRVYSNACKHVTTLLPTKRVYSDEMGKKRGQIKGQKMDVQKMHKSDKRAPEIYEFKLQSWGGRAVCQFK